MTSGSGFARANTIASRAILAIASGGKSRGGGGKVFGCGGLATPLLHRVHVPRPPPEESTSPVAADDVAGSRQGEKLGGRGAAGADAADNDFRALQLLAGDLEGV